MNIQCSGSSRSFAKETRVLKIRSIVAGIESGQWTTESADPLMTTEVAENSMSTILWSFGISSKLERWKSLISGYLMSWLKVKKICHFELSSLILCNNSKPFLNWIVMCDEKWVVYQIGDDQLSGWAKKTSKALPRTKLVPKIGHGHCLVVFLPVWSFWILAEPLHLRSRLSKLMRCTKNCKACSQHWSTEWAQFFSMTTSYHTLHQQLFKSWTNWTMKFCPTCHIHLTSQQPTSASSSISTSFCRQNTSTTSRRQKMLAKRWWILKKGFLCCRSKQTYISLAKMCQLKWFLFC